MTNPTDKTDLNELHLGRRPFLRGLGLTALGGLALASPFGAAFAADAAQAPEASAEGPFTVTDVEGRTVAFERRPQKFAVGNYILGFLFVSGGAGLAKVAALPQDGWEATRTGEYRVLTQAFPQLKSIPSIGGYHDDILKTETILSIRPDVLLINRSQFAANSAKVAVWEKAGIRTVVLDYHSIKLETHAKSTELLGKLLGREAVAESLIREYRDALTLVADRLKDLPDAEKPKVYVECGNMGLAAYGNSYNKTILWGAILEAAGARNIARDMKAPYGALDREFVLASNPDVIVIAGSIWAGHESDQMRMGLTVKEGEAKARLAGFASRPLWSRVKAVQEKRVLGVDHGSLRMMMDYVYTLWLAKELHPSRFEDVDVEKIPGDFYRRYLPEVDPAGTFFTTL